MSEAKLMNQLRDQNVVALYAVVEEPMCMVMEYCGNGALYDLLKSRAELDWKIRWKIAFECALGIHFMHSRTNKGMSTPILHRDIKSMNYLIAEDVHLRVADFGLSIKQEQLKSSVQRSREQDDSKVDEVGSVPWMAPELFKLVPSYSVKSDIYAYGIVLWEIASREDPYKDCPSATLLRECVKDGDRNPIPEGTPKEFDKLIQDCWAQVPEQRPTAAKVLERIRSAAGDDLDSDWTRETFMKALKTAQEEKAEASKSVDPLSFINSLQSAPSSNGSINSVANSMASGNLNSVANSMTSSIMASGPLNSAIVPKT